MSGQPSPEFQTLFESPGLPRFELPSNLDQIYGGFGLARPVVYADFVSSIDGVVALPGVPRSSALISGGDAADRFLVGLLRAAADAVVIGAGTFRAHDGPWTPEDAYPEAAEGWVQLRQTEGLSGQPTLVVVTASGDVGRSRSKLADVIVITTSEGAGRLGEYATVSAQVVELGAKGSIDMRRAIGWLKEHGYARILTEGGPKLMGEALKAQVVDELFLTVSPMITGGGERQQRPTLADGVDLLPNAPLIDRLLSIHRKDAYLFLRYALVKGDPSGTPPDDD
jgi:riboflavin biosynthesis pyrimidine reductase